MTPFSALVSPGFTLLVTEIQCAQTAQISQAYPGGPDQEPRGRIVEELSKNSKSIGKWGQEGKENKVDTSTAPQINTNPGPRQHGSNLTVTLE